MAFCNLTIFVSVVVIRVFTPLTASIGIALLTNETVPAVTFKLRVYVRFWREF